MKILAASQIKEVDSYTIDTEPISSVDLMERASAAFADKIEEQFDSFTSDKIKEQLQNNSIDFEKLVADNIEEQFDSFKSTEILEQLTLTTGLRNRGIVYRPGLYVLKETSMPAVLVEMGFISNPYDADLLANSPYLFSTGIYISHTHTP